MKGRGFVNHDCVPRTIVFVRGHHAHFLDHTHSGIYSSKNAVFSVQPRSWFQRDEKLRTIRVRPRVGHRDHARSGVFEIPADLVFEFPPVHTFTPPSGSRWITTLNHEFGYDSMKDGTVVVSRFRQGRDVVARSWGVSMVELDHERSDARYELNIGVAVVAGSLRHFLWTRRKRNKTHSRGRSKLLRFLSLPYVRT